MATKKISVTFLVIALLASSISISLIPAKSAGAADAMPKVDVWTDKGGKGVSDAGGTFTVGEKTVIYAYTNMPGQEYCQIWGPHGKELDESRRLTAAGTITFDLGTAEEKDIGNWQIMFGVSSGNYVGGDFLKWTVVAASSPEPSSPLSAPSTTPVPPAAAPASSPPPSPGADTQWQVTIGASKSSALDALIAVKMSKKALPENLAIDMDSDGKVTIQDAKAILSRAVRGQVGLSEEQSRLLARYASPETFTIIIVKDESTQPPVYLRTERWNYHTLGASFIFIDGKFKGYDKAFEFKQAVIFPEFSPNQFNQDMTLEDVNSIVGDIPQVGAQLVPELLPDAKIYCYQQGLTVGFQNDKLAYVCTDPFLIKSNK